MNNASTADAIPEVMDRSRQFFKIHYSRREYREEYLRSPEWRIRRDKIIARDPVCTLCDANRSTDAHHLTYERIHFELETDLIGVCRDCHNIIHRHPQLAETKDFLKLKQRFLFIKGGGKYPKRKKKVFSKLSWHSFRYGQPRNNFSRM